MAEILSTESSKAASFTSSLAAKGIHNSPGPFIGIVKNNVDPSRSGKLQVWISEMGGKVDDPGSWLTVSYCTPFYGVTPPETRSQGQDFQGSPQSYGMWFVPPDIGVKVMVIFIDGNKYKGYWFGCIPEWPNLHMVPGISAPVSKKSAVPVVEYNDADPASAGTIQNFYARASTPHAIQQQIYTKQGIISDPLRGPGTSSAFRETPSRVFGISTPGTEIGDDPVVSGDTGSIENTIKGRRGGHTFVMDDGDAQGKNVQFKLRSSTGHTILMSDTGGFIYVINAAGTAWIEMDAQGAINVYSGAQIQLSANSGINLDTKGAIKIHGKSVDIKSEGNVNIEGKDVNIKASGSAKVSGGKDVSLKGSKAFLTGDQCASVSGGTHVDIGGACVKIGTSASKATAAGGAQAPQNMPTKEPWSGHKGGASGATQPAAQPSYESVSGLSGGSGNYGAANNFGSSTVQQNYAELPNNIGPVKYTSGFQGSALGQASMYTTSVNNALTNTVTGAITNAIFDTGTTSYKNTSAIANLNHQSGATYNATNNLQAGSVDTSSWSTTEKQNNPGKLAYEKSDSRAIGNANGFAVYNRPEDGIAQIVVKIQSFINDPTTGLSNRNLQTVIARYLKISSVASSDVTNAVRYINNMTSISATSYLNMTDPRICISMVSALIQFLQGHMIYTYEQMVNGCAAGLKVSATTFANSLTGGSSSTQNGYGSPGTSGYVPVTSPALKNGGSSALETIGQNIVQNVVSNLVRTGVSDVVSTVTGSNAVNQVFTGGGSILSGGNRTGVPDSVQNFQVGDINNIVGSSCIGGTTECVGIAKGVFGTNNIGPASQWQGTGTGIIDSQGSVPVGTAVATFNFNGNYGPANSPGGASGVSHTAIITGYVDSNRQPLPQSAYNADGTVKAEYQSQIAGFQAVEQYNGSGGVIRSQTYMNGAAGATKNANNYQPIVVNGKTFTTGVLPNQQATKDTPVGTSSGSQEQGPANPNPAAPGFRSESAADAKASSSVEAKDVTAEKTTSTPEAGTTTAQPQAVGTDIQNTQTQIAAADQKIADSKQVSQFQRESIQQNQTQIENKTAQAQDLRNQQAEVRAQQQAVQEKYDNGQISASEYKSQMNTLNNQNQSLGNQARTLESDAAALTEQNRVLSAKADINDARVLDAQEQKASLQAQETQQANQLDRAEQSQTTSDFKPVVDNKPESNSAGGSVVATATSENTTAGFGAGTYRGQGDTENAISDRDTQTSTAVSGSGADRLPGQSTGSAQDTAQAQQAGLDSQAGSGADRLPGDSTSSAGDNAAQQANLDQQAGSYGDRSVGDGTGTTDNIPVGSRDSSNVDASGMTGGNAGADIAITGTTPDTGAGSALTGGAMTTPQGAAATGAGALSC